MSPIFRQALNADIDSAFAVYLEVFHWLNAKGIRQWLVPLTKPYFAARQAEGQLYVCIVDGDVAAIVLIANEGSRYWSDALSDCPVWWIKTLAVSRRFAGRSLGPYILGQCEEAIAAAGPTEIYLDCVSDGALPSFYQKHGYAALGSKLITYPSGNSFAMQLMRKTRPNKPLQVTPTTVTMAAYAPIAPVAGVPDL